MTRDILLQCASDKTEEAYSRWIELGFRFGDKGTHTSRTIMLNELQAVLDHCPPDTLRTDYSEEIVDHNILGKRTLSTRRLTNQRLGELYGLDSSIPIFRVMRYFWEVDEKGRPLLAMLTALARDPLLRATTTLVLSLVEGQELVKSTMLESLREYVGDRLNDNILDKVARNVSSSWTQSGHLEGRVRKKRHLVTPTPYVTTYALVLAYLIGARGQDLFNNPCVRVLDRSYDELVYLAMDAKRIGIIDMKKSGGLIHVSFDSLLKDKERELAHGAN